MARIEIKDLDENLIKKLDEQRKKYGINNRSDYLRLLINLDIMTNIVQIIKDKDKRRYLNKKECLKMGKKERQMALEFNRKLEELRKEKESKDSKIIEKK